MEGYLAKKGHLVPTWRVRYFIFDAESRTVAYYSNAKAASEGEKEKDTLTVTSICDIPDRPGSRVNRFDFLCFNQSKGETVLSVSAETQQLKERWLTVLNASVGKTDVAQHPRYREFMKATGQDSDRAGSPSSVGAAREPASPRGAAITQLIEISVHAARNIPRVHPDAEMYCTIVPLTIGGDEIKEEKRKTRASTSLQWVDERFVLGYLASLESASVVLIKLKAEDGDTDFGSVHIPLKPLTDPESPMYLSATTTQAHPLEARKAMNSVQGELHIQLSPVVVPTAEQMSNVAAAMMRGLDIADRSMFLKLHRACFLGQDAVVFLRSNAPAGLVFGTDEEAIMFGNCMMAHGLFKSVPNGEPFSNTYQFYRFRQHEPKQPSGGPSVVDTSAAASAASVEPKTRLRHSRSHVPKIAPKHQSRMSIKEFEVIKLLGTGAFGKVVLARHLQTKHIFAIKVLDKKRMSDSDKVNTWSERTVLNKVVHPFISTLEFAFQSPTKLFMGMEFFSGGDLHHHIHQSSQGRRGLSMQRTVFYAAEVTAGIAHLHSLKVIYRDLKGENVMIATDGHVKLVDFGLAKLHAATPRAAQSLVGSPFYVAPEVLESFQTKRGYGKACDWWSLGILVFEMLVGRTPFEAGNSRQQLYWNIQHADLKMPDSFDEPTRGLLRGLLKRDPNLRMGSWDEVPQDIMEHAFFRTIDWDKLIAKSLPPPWVPDRDRSYVDAEFERVTRVDSLLRSGVTAPSQLPEAFDQFTYLGEGVLPRESDGDLGAGDGGDGLPRGSKLSAHEGAPAAVPEESSPGETSAVEAAASAAPAPLPPAASGATSPVASASAAPAAAPAVTTRATF